MLLDILEAEALSKAYRRMQYGCISLCKEEYTKGRCTCCSFDTGLGNWIGLLSGEKEILENGDMENLSFKEVVGSSSLNCNRLNYNLKNGRCHDCHNRPLDCMFYPFYPLEFEENSSCIKITLIAGFPKCPLEKYMPNNDSSLDYTDTNEVVKHAIKVAVTSYLLVADVPSFKEEFKKAAEGFKGYNRKYIIEIPHSYIASYL